MAEKLKEPLVFVIRQNEDGSWQGFMRISYPVHPDQTVEPWNIPYRDHPITIDSDSAADVCSALHNYLVRKQL
jgi:hypothetical protein